MQEINKIVKSSKVKTVVCILGSIFVVLIIFQAGMFVGFRKAGFSYRVGEQYYKQINNKEGDKLMGMNRGDFENSHGAIGKIINISLPKIIVSDISNIEKTVVISTTTDIRKFNNSINMSDLKINDLVTIIGNPNGNAEIDARLIRIMPDPLDLQSQSMGVETIVK